MLGLHIKQSETAQKHLSSTVVQHFTIYYPAPAIRLRRKKLVAKVRSRFVCVCMERFVDQLLSCYHLTARLLL